MQGTADNINNSCAALSKDELDIVIKSADQYIDARNLFTKIVSSLGSVIESGYKLLPDNLKESVAEKVRDILEEAQKFAASGMEENPGKESSDRMYKAMVVASGAGGGAVGLAGILVELPVTTLLFFRSIADIARSRGEDLSDPVVQATCFEVFAYGGPLDEDDDADIAFFASRVGISRVAGPLVENAIAEIVIKYTANILPKVAAQAVPIVGGALGAAINYGFISFYQDIAHILFKLLPLERKYQSEMVRSCFASVVKERMSARIKRRK